jgi:hypothetical protein
VTEPPLRSSFSACPSPRRGATATRRPIRLAARAGRRGHDVLFLERDVPWYARTATCHAAVRRDRAVRRSLDELQARFTAPCATPTSSSSARTCPRASRWATGSLRRRRASPRSTTSTRRSRWPAGARGDTSTCARADPELPAVPVVHGRPDARSGWSGSSARRRRGPLYCSVDPTLLSRSRAGRPGTWATWARTAPTASPRSSGCCRPARRCPAAASSWPGRSTRRSCVAGERRAHRAPAARAAPRASTAAALHAERHARRHGRRPAGRRACACSRRPRAARPIISDAWGRH